MNTLLFSKITDKTIPIVYTAHASKRALQRCKIFMRQHERENPVAFLKDVFKNTVPDLSIIFSLMLSHK